MWNRSKYEKILLSVAALLLLLCLFPLSGLAQQKGFGVFAINEVNVRESPGGDILFKKQKGEELFILSSREYRGQTWYEVNTLDARRITPRTAWVRSDMVIPPEVLFSDVVQVAADHNLMIALKKDGTAVMGGEMHKYPHLMPGAAPDTWRQVKQVAAGFLTVYGLKEDGSLYKWGIRGPADGTTGVTDAQGGVVRLAGMDALDETFLGFMEDGSLYSLKGDGQGLQLLPPGSGITDFSAGLGLYDEAVVSLDGWVVSLSAFHDSIFTDADRAALALWRDIVQVETGFRSPVMEGASMAKQGAPLVAGIRQDGTVIALNPQLNQEVSAWTEMVKIESGDGFLAGLREDGTVAVAGENKHFIAKDLETWSGIMDIACGRTFCVGVTGDSRVLFAGEVQFTPN